MRRIKTCGCFLAATALLAGCTASQSSAASFVMVANPLKEYESINGMAQAVEFDFLIPAQLQDGYEIAACYTVSDKIVSIEFSDGENEVLYRTAELSDEYDEEVGISGDYTSYGQKETVQAGDYEVTFSFDAEDAPCLALWSGGGMLYALSGLTKEEAKNCILSLTEVDS